MAAHGYEGGPQYTRRQVVKAIGAAVVVGYVVTEIDEVDIAVVGYGAWAMGRLPYGR